MIAREWRGRVRPERADDYAAYLQRTGIPDYAATPGHRGTLVLIERGGEAAEFCLLTMWDSLEAVRAFAGEEISRARYYPGDPGYLLEMPERVRHYEAEWVKQPRDG